MMMARLPFSIQMALMSTGILSMALFLKICVPIVVDFSVYRAPLLWSSLLSWLKPPYLYLILNGIIISIAATSRFQQSRGTDLEKDQMRDDIPAPEIAIQEIDFRFNSKISSAEDLQSTVEEVVSELKGENATAAGEPENVLVNKSTAVMDNAPAAAKVLEDEDEFFISKSTWIPPKRMESPENLSDLLLLPADKPLASTRFGHRRPSKASPEGGRALRVVANSKRHETLENTWRMITEGRPMPLTRHVKKSEALVRGEWRKSGTLKDRINGQDSTGSNASSPPSSAVKLRTEPSLSQDELNRRVEAFIRKFNEEMRMQRQQSLEQYKEMMKRGRR